MFLKEKKNIILLYITEAHAADVWNIGLSAGEIINTHKTIEDRLNAVKLLKEKFNLSVPVYADNMNDEFEKVFACWPFRNFIIESGKVSYIGQPDDSTFDVLDMFK